MMEYLKNLPAFLVFLSIGGFGLCVMVFSRLFGGLGEAESDVDHDIESHDGSAHEHGGPSFFSVRIMSVLVTVFGFGGAISVQAGAVAWVASIIGLLGGTVVSLMVFGVAAIAYKSQATSVVSDRDLIGQVGTVVVGIAPPGIGRVRFTIGGVGIEKLAQVETSQGELMTNTTVQVVSVVGNQVVVRRL